MKKLSVSVFALTSALMVPATLSADALTALRQLGIVKPPAQQPSPNPEVVSTHKEEPHKKEEQLQQVHVDQNKILRLKEKIRALKLELERLRQGAARDNIINEPAPIAKKFMQDYGNLNSAQRNQEFNPVFIDIRDKQDVDTAYAVYDFLMKRYEQIAQKNNPDQNDIKEAEDLLGQMAKIGEAPGAFAQAVERHTKEQEAKLIQKQILEDQPFFQNVAQDAAARLNNAQNPPMLLLLLLRNPALIVKSPNLKKEQWRALGGYLEYLSINQLRALRYHLQKDNNRANIPEGEDGDSIKAFLEALTNKININAPPKAIRPFTRNSFRQYAMLINDILTPEEKAEREIQADGLSYQAVLVDARNREHDVNNPPMLLLFLLKDPTRIVQSGALSAVDWQRLEGFLPYLTVNQLRALRYHLQKDNNRNNIPNNEVGNAIKAFISSMRVHIERGGNPTPLDNVTKARFQQTYPALINGIH